MADFHQSDQNLPRKVRGRLLGNKQGSLLTLHSPLFSNCVLAKASFNIESVSDILTPSRLQLLRVINFYLPYLEEFH